MTKKTSIDYFLSSRGLDHRDRASLDSIISLMQETAGIDAHRIGIGSAKLFEQGLAWVITRFSIECNLEFGRGDLFQIVTWSRGYKSAGFYRDYELLLKNKSYAKASSQWAIVNVEDRKIMRQLGQFLPQQDQLEPSIQKDPCPRIASIKKAENAKLYLEKQAIYSEIDCNLHVNNSYYVSWIIEALAKDLITDPSLKEQKSFAIRSFAINYLHEVLLDQVVEIYGLKVSPSHYIFEGILKTSGDSSFKVEVKLSED